MQGYVALNVNDAKEVATFLTITSKERSSAAGFRGAATGTNFTNDRIDYKESQFRWAAKDVPGFKEEPFITTSKDYMSKINFELAYSKFPEQPIRYYMGSWEDINKQYSEDENFGDEVTGNAFLKKVADEITAGLSTSEQKIGAIERYVKNAIQWDGFSRRYTTKPLRKVLDDKKGNSAEINLLLASILNKAGFKVSPVLVSTRDHGFVRESIAVSSQFNYVVCLVVVDGKQVLLDATDKLLPAGVLPARCLNGRGFVVSKGGNFSWVELKSPIRSRNYFMTEMVLAQDGSMKGKIEAEHSGYYAQHERKEYLTSGEQDYVKSFVAGRSWTIEKSTFANTSEVTEPFKETYEVSIEDQVTSAGDVIYVNPFLVLRMGENPFKLETRQYPVDFGSPIEHLLISKFTIPDGYTIDELPKSQLLKLPENAAKYMYNVTFTGNQVTLTSNLQINSSLFSQDEYPHLREFYNRVVAKQAEQIVLKKK
jgi:hypothetical protein